MSARQSVEFIGQSAQDRRGGLGCVLSTGRIRPTGLLQFRGRRGHRAGDRPRSSLRICAVTVQKNGACRMPDPAPGLLGAQSFMTVVEGTVSRSRLIELQTRKKREVRDASDIDFSSTYSLSGR
jgi:hypothetical protein